MFDKLIVSEPEGADFKTRRSYFMVSSVVVGVLFLAAVVFSIFASDFGLGTREFELTEMLTPTDIATDEPEAPRQQPAKQTTTTSSLPTRQAIIPRLDESPIIPTTTSVVPNTQMTRPHGAYQISLNDSDPVNPGGNGRPTGPDIGDPTGIADPITNEQNASNKPSVDVEPPPTIKKAPAKTISGGVVNGNAISLPKPVYSAAAKAVGAQGIVDVQALIDESGRVVSAKAVSGNMLLRPAAEQAARNARFTPTLLSKVAVKVTGVIVYNFVR